MAIQNNGLILPVKNEHSEFRLLIEFFHFQAQQSTSGQVGQVATVVKAPGLLPQVMIPV